MRYTTDMKTVEPQLFHLSIARFPFPSMLAASALRWSYLHSSGDGGLLICETSGSYLFLSLKLGLVDLGLI